MKSLRIHDFTHKLTIGLTILPFVFAGWLFASWLASSALAAGERDTLVVIDPPQRFYEIAHRLGFEVTDTSELTELEMTAVTVLIPKGHHPHSATFLLRNSIPELIVDGSSFRINQ